MDGRTFLGVPDRSALQPFTVPDRLHGRSMNVFHRLRPYYDQKTQNGQKFKLAFLKLQGEVKNAETVFAFLSGKLHARH